MEHYRTTGERIGAAVDAYNKSVASLQTRFFPAARRFQELTAIAEELTEASPIGNGINLPPPPVGLAEVSEQSRWFVARDKQRLGPFTQEQLSQMIAVGMVGGEEMVMEEGKRQWGKVQDVEVLVRLVSANSETAQRTTENGAASGKG
jgi:hypothetical protein